MESKSKGEHLAKVSSTQMVPLAMGVDNKTNEMRYTSFKVLYVKFGIQNCKIKSFLRKKRLIVSEGVWSHSTLNVN